MENIFGLIYFIHDSLDDAFILNALPNIRKAELTEKIIVILIHNRRKEFKARGGKEFVTYETNVQEVVKTGATRSELNSLMEKTVTWQEGFSFAIEYLVEKKKCKRFGLITLSHSAGFVINRNNERLPILKKMRYIFNRLRNQSRIDNFKYIEKKRTNGSRFVAAVTVVDQVEEISHAGSQALFAAKYKRGINVSFCKQYEGLFTFQLSEFLKSKDLKFTFIIFSNCNIQLYDNGYLFSPITEFMGGAQSLNDFTFWDFPTICNTLKTHIEATSLIVNEQIFDLCEKKYFLDSTDQTMHYFLTRTEYFSNLHCYFSKIIRAIEEKVKIDTDYRSQIIQWLSSAPVTSDFQELPFFDILLFFKIANEKGNNLFGANLQQFRTILETKIVHKKSSQGENHCGFSLYFPRSKQEFIDLKGERCNYFYRSDKNEFTNDSRYDELLLALYE